MHKVLYTRKQACDALGISLFRLNSLISNGMLDARKMGRKVVITAASINALPAKLLAKS